MYLFGGIWLASLLLSLTNYLRSRSGYVDPSSETHGSGDSLATEGGCYVYG